MSMLQFLSRLFLHPKWAKTRSTLLFWKYTDIDKYKFEDHISAFTWALIASDKFLLKIIILSLFKNVEVLSVHEISLCKYK